jgi:hypothetical protein
MEVLGMMGLILLLADLGEAPIAVPEPGKNYLSEDLASAGTWTGRSESSRPETGAVRSFALRLLSAAPRHP